MWKDNMLSREIIGVKGHEEGCNYTQSNVVFSQKRKNERWTIQSIFVKYWEKDVASDVVSNECWSSEIGGASRRRNMGPPFGRPHKSCIHRYREMGDISIIG